MGLTLMNELNGKLCGCGKVHSFSAQVISGSGCVQQLPQWVEKLHCNKPFLLADRNTWQAAGQQVWDILKAASIPCTSYILTDPEPDEQAVGSVVMHYDPQCDLIIGIGSGVINDIGKILSVTTGKPYIIIATAPSMDGYASASSSMTRDGLKISLSTRSADVILGDTDILCKAPLHMMRSGLGDMLAKYVSICEWRIANLITGEYYCPQIAQLIRSAVKRCTDNAEGLLEARPEAVQAVFEGLVIGGVAMNYAGLSRPASGVEHYISHILDMRAAEFGTKTDLHGIQCAIGTLIALRLYEKIKDLSPSKETALAYVKRFDYENWKSQLRSLLGKGAESMIALEETEHKYDPRQHEKRLQVILEHWKDILQIIGEELPPAKELETLLDKIGAPKTLDAIGCADVDLSVVFQATKDIRDKYVLSRLAWDLGIIEELV